MISKFLSHNFVLRFLCKLFSLRSEDLLLEPNLSLFKRRVLRKKLENSYESNFRSLNFKYAYRDKLLLAIAYSRGYFLDYIKESKNYLSVLSSNDLYKFLDLEESIIEELQTISLEKIFLENHEKKICKKIVFLGPSSKKSDFLDLKNFDLVVLNKPPKIDLSSFSSKILLITNNVYSLEKADEVINWFKKNPESLIISPQNIEGTTKADKIFSLFPSFGPFGSPMGLQRSLLVLNYYYNFEKIDLRGFNFSLTDQPYKDWYPSIMKEESEDFKRAIIQTNLRHDLVLNILLL